MVKVLSKTNNTSMRCDDEMIWGLQYMVCCTEAKEDATERGISTRCRACTLID